MTAICWWSRVRLFCFIRAASPLSPPACTGLCPWAFVSARAPGVCVLSFLFIGVQSSPTSSEVRDRLTDRYTSSPTVSFLWSLVYLS